MTKSKRKTPADFPVDHCLEQLLDTLLVQSVVKQQKKKPVNTNQDITHGVLPYGQF